MPLASGAMTVKNDRKPITLQCKVYWIHENFWDDYFIAKYHTDAPALAKEIRTRKVDMSNLENAPIDKKSGSDVNRFTCEDFVFEVLVEFASRNKLPLKIVTGADIFKNIDPDYKKSPYKNGPATPAGFAVDLAAVTGARDVAKNASAIPDSELKPGDIFLEWNKGHSQMLVSASPSRIEIMQGNFPGLESNFRRAEGWILQKLSRRFSAYNRESPVYLGMPVESAVYEKQNGKWLYQRQYGNYRGWDDDVWKTMTEHLRWNFLGFNY